MKSSLIWPQQLTHDFFGHLVFISVFSDVGEMENPLGVGLSVKKCPSNPTVKDKQCYHLLCSCESNREDHFLHH